MIKRYFYLAGKAEAPATVSFKIYGKVQQVSVPFADSEPCYMYYSTDGTTWYPVPGNVSFINKFQYTYLGTITAAIGSKVYLRTVDGNNDSQYKISSCWTNGCTGNFLSNDSVYSVTADIIDVYATVRFSSTGHWYYY
jgi:hypothetical protein